MAEAASAAGAPRVSRLDRRKARTRQALIDAAVRLIADFVYVFLDPRVRQEA